MQNNDRQPWPGRRAPGGAPVHFEHRRPEPTTLYRPARQHAATGFKQTAAAVGADLPLFLKDEFDAWLNAASCTMASCGCAAATATPLRRLRPRQAGRVLLQTPRREILDCRSPHEAFQS